MQGGYTTDLTGETILLIRCSGDFDFLGWDDGSSNEDPAFLSFLIS